MPLHGLRLAVAAFCSSGGVCVAVKVRHDMHYCMYHEECKVIFYSIHSCLFNTQDDLFANFRTNNWDRTVGKTATTPLPTAF